MTPADEWVATEVLRPLKLKSRLSSPSQSAGKGVAVGSPFGESADHRPAGIAETEQFGHLLKGLAGGIVTGAAQAGGGHGVLDRIERGVTAGDDQGSVGKFGLYFLPAGRTSRCPAIWSTPTQGRPRTKAGTWQR